MRRDIYRNNKNRTGTNEKRLIYGIGFIIIIVFAFAFFIAPYQSPTKEEGEKFLEKNKLKRRVRVLKSGLQYKVLSRSKYEELIIYVSTNKAIPTRSANMALYKRWITLLKKYLNTKSVNYILWFHDYIQDHSM